MPVFFLFRQRDAGQLSPFLPNRMILFVEENLNWQIFFPNKVLHNLCSRVYKITSLKGNVLLDLYFLEPFEALEVCGLLLLLAISSDSSPPSIFGLEAWCGHANSYRVAHSGRRVCKPVQGTRGPFTDMCCLLLLWEDFFFFLTQGLLPTRQAPCHWAVPLSPRGLGFCFIYLFIFWVPGIKPRGI